MTERQLQEIGRYGESSAFSADERLALDLAVEMAKAPVAVPDELLARLRERFGEAELVELAAAIAWESYRARFNRVFGVSAVGFSEGAACALPERGDPTRTAAPVDAPSGVSPAGGGAA